MNDLDVLRALGDDLDTVDAPDAAGAPPRLRHRIVTGIADDDHGHHTVVRRQRRAPLAGIAAFATTVTVVALAIVLAVTVQRAGFRQAADQPVPAVGMDARDVLLAAADTARDERATPPPADGWIYTRTIVLHVDWAAQGRYQWGTESWWAVNGESVWTFDATGRKPYLRCEEGPRAGCIPPGYLTDLPDDPAAVFDALHASNMAFSLVGNTGGEVATELGRAWELLLAHRVAAPQARAALYEALATLPDLTVTPDVTAADGSVGTAIGERVEVTDEGTGRTVIMRGELIFDPDTDALIGWRWVYDTGDPELGIPAGAVKYTVANLVQEAVPERWVRSDGTTAHNRQAREEHAWEISSAQPGPLWKEPTVGTGPHADQAPDGPPVEQASAIPGGG
jgi:hypothetical protein